MNKAGTGRTPSSEVVQLLEQVAETIDVCSLIETC
jgi:hypothetical protein